jgi:hypothetical protein
MLIEIKKEVIETIELKVPGYYKDNYVFHFINEAGVITSVREKMISHVLPDTFYYQKDLSELSQKEPSTKEEFEKAWDATLDRLIGHATKSLLV